MTREVLQHALRSNGTDPKEVKLTIAPTDHHQSARRVATVAVVFLDAEAGLLLEYEHSKLEALTTSNCLSLGHAQALWIGRRRHNRRYVAFFASASRSSAGLRHHGMRGEARHALSTGALEVAGKATDEQELNKRRMTERAPKLDCE